MAKTLQDLIAMEPYGLDVVAHLEDVRRVALEDGTHRYVIAALELAIRDIRGLLCELEQCRENC